MTGLLRISFVYFLFFSFTYAPLSAADQPSTNPSHDSSAMASLASGSMTEEPKNAQTVCARLLQAKSDFGLSEYTSYFAQSFRNSISFEELISIFSGLAAETGSCISYQALQTSPGHFALSLLTDQGFAVSILLVIDPPSGLFSGLLLNGVDDPSITVQSWDDVGQALKKIAVHGKASAALVTSDSKISMTQNPDGVFAIGSTFKLYILGALQRSIALGQHSWDETLDIKEEWKSLPSGTMQNLPAGTPVKLFDYAANMISISDNTAADHLLYFLGRNAVESMLPVMGNEYASMNSPLLSTLEMFKLKWAIPPTETARYIQDSPIARLAVLGSLSSLPRSAVGSNGVDSSLPTDIDSLEWFSSPLDNCDAVFWLARQNSPKIRVVLSRNTPLVQTGGHWSYVGYKGGSEPGVISMTYLLESEAGGRACLSVSWNDPKQGISEYRFMDIVGKTLKLAESLIP